MFVSAAAASLEDTGEDYLNATSGAGANGVEAQINPGSYAVTGNSALLEGGKFTPTANNNGYTSPGGSPPRFRPLGTTAPASPGMSLLDLAGACSEQQKRQKTRRRVYSLFHPHALGLYKPRKNQRSLKRRCSNYVLVYIILICGKKKDNYHLHIIMSFSFYEHYVSYRSVYPT